MDYKEEDFLELSGLQHYLYCKRQWALIHIEKQWVENILTTEGMLMHKRAHNPEYREKRGDIVRMNAVRIHSYSLGVSGECDVLELHHDENGILISNEPGTWSLYPIEYKRGRKKKDECDEAQLCAQAMCLEEMYCCKILEGALFYGETRRHEKVIFSDKLRSLVKESLEEMHSLYKKGYTPKVKAKKGCESCSLKEICLPVVQGKKVVSDYIIAAIKE
nr:CRISPR-associated protein Cas4 [uncultured Butyrivibrio sp.]